MNGGRRREDEASEPDEKCQKLFHGTYLLCFNGLPRRTIGRSEKSLGSRQADSVTYYLVRRPWLDITPFPNKKLSLLLAGRQFENSCAMAALLSSLSSFSTAQPSGG